MSEKYGNSANEKSDGQCLYFLNNLNFIMKSSKKVILVVRDFRSVNEGMF